MPAIVSSLIGVGITAIGPIVALILVLNRARGRSRLLGTIGAVLLLVVDVAQGVFNLLLPMIMNRFQLPTSSISLLFVPGTLLSVLGIILLGAAVAAAFSSNRPGGTNGPSGPTPSVSL